MIDRKAMRECRLKEVIRQTKAESIDAEELDVEELLDLELLDILNDPDPGDEPAPASTPAVEPAAEPVNPVVEPAKTPAPTVNVRAALRGPDGQAIQARLARHLAARGTVADFPG